MEEFAEISVLPRTLMWSQNGSRMQSLAPAVISILCAMQLSLCGQDPETALNSALASVNFFLQQQQLYFEFREAQLEKKISKVQEACKKKLQEVHTGYTAVRTFLVVLMIPTIAVCIKMSAHFTGQYICFVDCSCIQPAMHGRRTNADQQLL